jgi:hypothetical protein
VGSYYAFVSRDGVSYVNDGHNLIWQVPTLMARFP